jgi:4-hydroxy-tetrahydrodipicolinate reductase
MNRKINYGLIGNSGKMGKEIEGLLKDNGHVCVYRKDINSEEYIDKPEVLIDFSSPTVLNETIDHAIEYHAPLIIGTTGLKEDQIQSLVDLGKTLPVVQSYNFSIGIQMFLKAVEMYSNYISDWDTEVLEIHHRYKKDKPSGTALMIQKALGREVPISSQRIGGVFGDHIITFGNDGETISINHRAISRRAFTEGVLKSVNFVLDRDNGFYTFKDVMFYGDK